MGHKVILNRIGNDGGTALTSEAGPTYTFEYEPQHDQTPAQAGEQFAKIQKLLEKAVAVANGAPAE